MPLLVLNWWHRDDSTNQSTIVWLNFVFDAVVRSHRGRSMNLDEPRYSSLSNVSRESRTKIGTITDSTFENVHQTLNISKTHIHSLTGHWMNTMSRISAVMEQYRSVELRIERGLPNKSETRMHILICIE